MLNPPGQVPPGRRSTVAQPNFPCGRCWWKTGPSVRDSWTRLINSFPDFTCVCACCHTGEEALRVIPEIQPDVILMDIFLPRMSGIECTTRSLKTLLPENVQIVILTAMDDQGLVFMALEAGADGYLLKTDQTGRFARGFAGRSRRWRAHDQPDCPTRYRILPSESQGSQ